MFKSLLNTKANRLFNGFVCYFKNMVHLFIQILIFDYGIFLFKFLNLLLSLIAMLIVLHELGPFYSSQNSLKLRVEKFYLFFDIKYSLFKKKIGDTVYGIGWLPLGGYVKISGMIDESMDTDQMERRAYNHGNLDQSHAWQRLIIMLGGVTVNFILAAVFHICCYGFCLW